MLQFPCAARDWCYLNEDPLLQTALEPDQKYPAASLGKRMSHLCEHRHSSWSGISSLPQKIPKALAGRGLDVGRPLLGQEHRSRQVPHCCAQ